jgi:hypothetical protein
MKLKSLQIFPSGSNGWGTDLLRFGDHVTQLFGPNGCGKTPIVQSIAFCLGYPSVFRHDIYNRCNYAILQVETHDGILQLKRVYSKDVDIEITEPNGTTLRVFSEEDYSGVLFDRLGIAVNNLITNNNKSTKPYLSTILPLFYVDQDNGYTEIYCPKSRFIKDQFSEMMRLLFRLPVKNSFDSKKEQLEAKRRLEYLDKVVVEQSRQLNLAKESVSAHIKNSRELSAEIIKLEIELEALKSHGINQNDSVNSLDRLIVTHRQSLRDLEFELEEISKRRDSVEKIASEINTEINTLNLNEEARRVFISFNEICSNPNCQLFSASSDAYSKNLLYLKDQLKDLQRNESSDQLIVDKLKLEINTSKELIQKIIDVRNETLNKSEISSVVIAVSEIKNEIFRLQNELNQIENFESLQENHFNLILERNLALDKYESFGSSHSLNPSLIRLKADLRQLLLNWMDELHTTNISRDITFKNDFTPILGKEVVAQLTGSTKVRAILAFHAAILELAAQHFSVFKFLILDTPKQHEIHNDHLDQYMVALKKICEKYELQIIFSTTEYQYSGDQHDIKWTPQYQGEEQLMFMKRAS